MGNPQTPQETNPFVPRRWLRGGHVQTLASFLIQRRIHLPAPEARMIEVAPGVQVLCHCHWQQDRAKALTIIVVHGLEGSSESQYMLGIAEKALRAGMNVIRYNQRNCGGTDALAPVLYHSGLSNDIAAVAREIIARDGVSRLALVGFSMGGNLVLKLAGEWGEQPPPQFAPSPPVVRRWIWRPRPMRCMNLRTGSTRATSCGLCADECATRRGSFPDTSTLSA